MLDLEMKKYIKEHASKESPKECCGLIVSNNGKYSPVKCYNSASDKLRYATIGPFDYIRAANLGKIVGMYHSQENDIPSNVDAITAFDHNIYSIVYARNANKFFIINPDLKKYLSNKFEINKSDCLSLVINYYKSELNISINDYNRDGYWFTKSPRIITDNFQREGFVEIIDGTWEKHDILLFGKNRQEISHMGVYVGNNLLLHHQRDAYSCLEYLNSHIKRNLQLIIRHNSIK